MKHLNDSNPERVGSQRVALRGLVREDPDLGERQCCLSVRASRHTIDDSPRHNHTARAIRDRDRETLALGDHGLGRGHFQKVDLVEGVKGPEHLIARLGLELAAPDRDELVVDEDAPKLGGGLGVGGDAGDEEIVELGAEGAVEGEAGELGAGVQGVGGRIAGGRVRSVVGAIARVRTPRGSGDVTRPRDDGSLVKSGFEAFDTELGQLVVARGGLCQRVGLKFGRKGGHCCRTYLSRPSSSGT